MAKRVEGQRVYFAPLERLIETIIFTGRFHFGILSCIRKFLKFRYFSGFLSWYKKEIKHNNIKTGPTNLFEMENSDPITYF